MQHFIAVILNKNKLTIFHILHVIICIPLISTLHTCLHKILKMKLNTTKCKNLEAKCTGLYTTTYTCLENLFKHKFLT